MKIDKFLPAFDFNAVHQVGVEATPEATIRAAIELRPSELSQLVFWMLNLRELPAILSGRTRRTRAGERPFLAQLYAEGFIPLAEEQDEIVFGLIGQFWKLTGGRSPEVQNPDDFINFKQTGFAKVATNILAQTDGDRTSLSTETRIWAPDPETLAKFAFYWKLISFGSGWIRTLWMRAIKRRAERFATP